MPPFCRTGADRGQTYQQHLPDTCHFPTATPALSLLRSLTKSLFGGIPRGTLLVLHPRDDDKENPKTPSRENSNCTHRFSAFRLSLQALGRWRSWGKTCTARPGGGGGRAREQLPYPLHCGSVMPVPVLLGSPLHCGARLGAQTVSPPILTHPWPSLLPALPPQGAPDSPPGRRWATWTEAPLAGGFLSKSCLISLLRRLQGWGWHGATVVEAFKLPVGKASSIKGNQWPLQPGPGPCWGERAVLVPAICGSVFGPQTHPGLLEEEGTTRQAPPGEEGEGPTSIFKSRGVCRAQERTRSSREAAKFSRLGNQPCQVPSHGPAHKRAHTGSHPPKTSAGF